MQQTEFYEKIAQIARNSHAPINIYELADRLGLPRDRGIFSRIRGAVNYFSEKDPKTAGEIKRVFVDDDGSYPYA